MGSVRGDEPLPMLDLDVPEFFISHIRIEPAGGNCIRIFGCVERSGQLIPRYSVIIPLDKSATMARQTFEAAADRHNVLQIHVEMNGDTEH
jgi:hypothetical protein